MIAVPAVWLRDNCRCGACRDPRSGQRRFRLADLPADVAVERVEWGGEGAARTATVVFAPDGHRSVFPASWLEGPLSPAGDGRRDESTKQLWVAADLPGPPTASWGAYCAGGDVRRRVLDGFRAFADLRASDPDAFGVLWRTPPPFAWTDGHAFLAAERPAVETDPAGCIAAVRWNDRSLGTLRLPAAGRGAGRRLRRPPPLRPARRRTGPPAVAPARRRRLPAHGQHPGAAREGPLSPSPPPATGTCRDATPTSTASTAR